MSAIYTVYSESTYAEMPTAQLRESLRETKNSAAAERISRILQHHREKELIHKAESKLPETSSADSS